MSEVLGITPKGIAGSFYVMVRLDLSISGIAKKMLVSGGGITGLTNLFYLKHRL